MVIAVLGKIASGKSEIVSVLKRKGFSPIYADKITRNLYKPGAKGQLLIERSFGRDYLSANKEVDRVKLRDLVFTQPTKLRLLNKIIHPLVYKEIRRKLMSLRAKNVVIELTYMGDDAFGGFVDKVIWVERSKEKIKKTLVDERGFSVELAKKAVECVKKPNKVDFVIRNNGSIGSLNFLVSRVLDL